MTGELRPRIEREYAAGATQEAVSQRTGVPVRTLTHWQGQGRIVRRQLAPVPAPVEPERPVPDVLARAEPGLVAAIVTAAKGGHWQAAAWLLERAFPDRWARPDARQTAPPSDAFSELDQLRRKR